MVQAAQAQHEKEVASHTRAYTRLYGDSEKELQQQSKNFDCLQTQLTQVQPLYTLLSATPVLPVVLCTSCLAAECYLCQTQGGLFPSIATVLQCGDTVTPDGANPVFCPSLSAELNAVLHAAKEWQLFKPSTVPEKGLLLQVQADLAQASSALSDKTEAASALNTELEQLRREFSQQQSAVLAGQELQGKLGSPATTQPGQVT